MPQAQATSMLIQMVPYNPDTEQCSVNSEKLKQFANDFVIARKTAFFLTAIGTITYTLLWNLIAHGKPSYKGYRDLVAVLKTHLVPKPLGIHVAERFNFTAETSWKGRQSLQNCSNWLRMQFQAVFRWSPMRLSHIGAQSEATQKCLLVIRRRPHIS